jgi:glycosyltransferase involved in cell wall biosynthesis
VSAPPAAGPRVLFVDHAAVLGGAELSLLDLAGGMRERATVLLFQDGPFRERLEEAGVTAAVLPAPPALLDIRRGGRAGAASAPSVAAHALRLVPECRRHDVVYANSQKAFAVAAFAGWIARRPVVWHLRDLLTPEHFSASHRRLVTGLARRFATRVVANSAATRDAFVAAGGPAEHVRVVYNGIDPAPFEAVDDGDAARLRAELGVGDAPLVGVFSRLAEWKGQHHLLDALAGLPAAHALLVGDALFPGDEAYATGLRERAAQPDLAGRVHFLGFRRDVPALMRACDVVAHTSAAPEPFGRVIVEGMLARRPVVATAAGGAVELVADGRTGLLVPPGDARALRDALARLFGEPTLGARLAEAGAEEARRRFGVERMRAEVADLVAEVGRGRPAPRSVVAAG